MPQRVAITAPSGRDSEVIAGILGGAGLETFIERNVDSLISAIDDKRAGALVIAEEAFREGALERLASRLSRQEPWSDIPIIFLALPNSTSRVPVQVINKLGNVTVLDRPLRPLVLVTAAQAALRDRARQHDAADYINQIEAQSAALLASKGELESLNYDLEGRIAAVLSERRVLADIVEGTDSFVQVSDMQFRWLAANRAAVEEFERIFGIRPKIGESMLDTLDHLPEQRQAVERVWRRALAGEEFLEQGEYGDASRDRRTYEMKFNVLRDSSGKQIGAYQFVTDVTDRVVKERQLEDANEKMRQMAKLETLGQLTGGVAHDFNNLLTPIVGGLDILRRMHSEDARSSRIISGATEAADRATTLVQRLLAFARQQTLQRRVVDIGSLIRGIQDLLARTLGPEIKIDLQMPETRILAMIDPSQLELAILNLAVNSRDAMEGRGTITIGLRRASLARRNELDLSAGSYALLSVSDTGGGMDPDLLKKAIEPFFTTKGVGQGTGLGLSMVHGLAAQFGGSLKLHNMHGSGMTAEIWLPEAMDCDPQPDPETRSDEREVSRNLRILLVDDDALAREAIDILLGEMGHVVTPAPSGEVALGKLAQQSFDVVIADVLMPHMRGDQLAAIVRKDHGLPVLLLTGHPGELNDEARDLPILPKPVRKGQLTDMLSKVLADTVSVSA